MASPDRILADAFERASNALDIPAVTDDESLAQISYIARCLSNRAGVRMLMTCALAKIHRPKVDIRKPYTEIRDDDVYSGRAEYDEKYIGPFAIEHNLPVNLTTAFLTPGFRTVNVPLAPPLVISGRPKKMYVDVIHLLDKVHQGTLTPEALLRELLRQLILLKIEQDNRLEQLKQALRDSEANLPLSSEEIVTLITQHLACANASRLPVLVIAAIYDAAGQLLGEQARPLLAHNAADEQTGALGDIEITLASNDRVVTSYEIKSRKVTREDIEAAIRKIAQSPIRINNYIFVTTAEFDDTVLSYASSLYRDTGGVEFAILDCVAFLRHFLHLFHRIRYQFLESYQSLVLAEPESAVNQPLKEAFLALRRVAELDSST